MHQKHPAEQREFVHFHCKRESCGLFRQKRKHAFHETTEIDEFVCILLEICKRFSIWVHFLCKMFIFSKTEILL